MFHFDSVSLNFLLAKATIQALPSLELQALRHAPLPLSEASTSRMKESSLVGARKTGAEVRSCFKSQKLFGHQMTKKMRSAAWQVHVEELQ